jgi:methylmalonyl-CoA/ethylmalonyl-CoA epimerase
MSKEKSLLDLKNFIQIAIIVPDTEAAAKEWSTLLGVPMPEIAVQPKPENPSESLTYRGTPASYELKLASIKAPQGFIIELHQCDENDSTFREYVNKHGYGVHHLGFAVGDRRDEVVEGLEGRGYDLRTVGYYPGGSWTIVDTENVLGVNLNVKPHL